MSRPQDWWPLSDGDPVPGDPETLAALGKRMSDAAGQARAYPPVPADLPRRLR
jgi:hypothetical protein